MKKTIIYYLEKIYSIINDECKLYDYNCGQCPHDKYCGKIDDLITTINDCYKEKENEKIYKINENKYIAETIEECKSGIIIIIKGIAYIVILGVLFNFISKLF